MKKFDNTILELIESSARNFKATPLNLGAFGGGGGGVGSPPGGYIGQLPQYRVAYDQTEAATLATLPSGLTGASGWSLVDNLNHIRYRLQSLEAGSGVLIVDDWDGNPTISPTNHITFSGAIVTQLSPGHALIVVSGGAGGGLDTAAGDARYLKLDTSNDPLTDQLQIINNNANAGGIYVQTIGDAYTLDVEQYADDSFAVESPALFVGRVKTGGAPSWNHPIVEILDSTDANPNAGAGFLKASVFGTDRMILNARPLSNGVAYEFGTTTNMAVDGKIILLKDAGTDSFWVTGSGWTYDRRGLLVEEAPINGSGYMRKNGGWVIASSGGSGSFSGDANRVVLTDSGGDAFTPAWLGWGTDTHEYVEFGLNRPNKVAHAGKIGYETFGNDYLYIVGAASGVFDVNRNVKILDNLYVDNYLVTPSINLSNPSATYNINGVAHTHDASYVKYAESQVNLLINGGFDFAQRQTPTAFSTIADNKYSADRWRMTRENADIQYVRQDALGETSLTSVFYGQFKKITNAGKFHVCQIVEGANSVPLRNKTVIFQVKMKASSSKTIRMAILELQNAGTIDSIPATLVTAFNADGTDPTLGSNVAVITAAQSKSVTTSWQSFSVSVTVPSNSKNIICALWSDADFSVNDTLSVAEAGLFTGSAERAWEPMLFADELTRVYRFCERTDDATGNNITGGLADSTSNMTGFLRFLVEKFKAPTCTVTAASDFSIRYTGGAITTATSVSFSSVTKQGATLTVVGTGTPLTAGQSVNLRCVNGTGYMLYDADL